MDRPPAPIASEAYDPLLTKAGSKSRSAAIHCRAVMCYRPSRPSPTIGLQ